MKRILIIITNVLAISVLIAVIINNKKSIEYKMITVNTMHSYLYKDGMEIQIPIYLNSLNHPMNDIKYIDNIYFSNINHSKKIKMNLLSIELKNEEKYLNEIFYEYHYIFEMPKLESFFFIEDVYMNIELKNNNEYSLYLGDLFLNYYKSDGSLFDWEGIQAFKKENSFLPTVHKVVIDYIDSDIIIQKVSINGKDNLDFSTKNHQLIINLDTIKDRLVFYFPVIVEYIYNDKIYNYVLHNYPFIIEYNILEESGLYVNVYSFN